MQTRTTTPRSSFERAGSLDLPRSASWQTCAGTRRQAGVRAHSVVIRRSRDSPVRPLLLSHDDSEGEGASESQGYMQPFHDDQDVHSR